MSRKAFVFVVVIGVIAGAYIGFSLANRGGETEVAYPDTESLGDYGYRCGDGTEFTMHPSADMMTIRIVPATSADYIRETTLTSAPSESGVRYEGDGVVFHGVGETVTLSTENTEPTECTPMTLPDEAPFNFGD